MSSHHHGSGGGASFVCLYRLYRHINRSHAKDAMTVSGFFPATIVTTSFPETFDPPPTPTPTPTVSASVLIYLGFIFIELSIISSAVDTSPSGHGSTHHAILSKCSIS